MYLWERLCFGIPSRSSNTSKLFFSWCFQGHTSCFFAFKNLWCTPKLCNKKLAIMLVYEKTGSYYTVTLNMKEISYVVYVHSLVSMCKWLGHSKDAQWNSEKSIEALLLWVRLFTSLPFLICCRLFVVFYWQATMNFHDFMIMSKFTILVYLCKRTGTLWQMHSTMIFVINSTSCVSFVSKS